MNDTKPPLVIISGPPGAGKSTIARPLATRLGLPLLSKDDIKEKLADAMGDISRAYSSQLGGAAFVELYSAANELLTSGRGVVVESFFHKGRSEADLMALVALSRAVFVHVHADHDVLISRFERRIESPDRHAIHNDESRVGQLRQYLLEGVGDPVEIGLEPIVIDTTYGPIDVEELVMIVRDALDGEESE